MRLGLPGHTPMLSCMEPPSLSGTFMHLETLNLRAFTLLYAQALSGVWVTFLRNRMFNIYICEPLCGTFILITFVEPGSF